MISVFDANPFETNLYYGHGQSLIVVSNYHAKGTSGLMDCLLQSKMYKNIIVKLKL
jgi:hypothetical protein